MNLSAFLIVLERRRLRNWRVVQKRGAARPLAGRPTREPWLLTKIVGKRARREETRARSAQHSLMMQSQTRLSEFFAEGIRTVVKKPDVHPATKQWLRKSGSQAAIARQCRRVHPPKIGPID